MAAEHPLESLTAAETRVVEMGLSVLGQLRAMGTVQLSEGGVEHPAGPA